MSLFMAVYFITLFCHFIFGLFIPIWALLTLLCKQAENNWAWVLTLSKQRALIGRCIQPRKYILEEAFEAFQMCAFRFLAPIDCRDETGGQTVKWANANGWKKFFWEWIKTAFYTIEVDKKWKQSIKPYCQNLESETGLHIFEH